MSYYRWLTRGARSASYELWPRKPVLVRGDWKAKRGSPKRYYTSERVSADVARLITPNLPVRPSRAGTVHP